MARWQPSYFQTPDEKRMAAIRANPTDLPTRQVRPMLPNNYDATGGTNKWGAPNASIPQYLENNRKMYTMEDAPTPDPAPTSRWEAPGVSGALAINAKYGTPGGVNNLGSFPMPSTQALQIPQAPPAPTPDAWDRGELGPAMRGDQFSALTNRPTAGQRWGTALDKAPVSVSARGPVSRARQEQRLVGGQTRGRTGYGGYQ
jgi:hypothetical protein